MYASNTPISRPVNTKGQVDADLGGISWSNTKGLVFTNHDEYLPIKPPEVRDVLQPSTNL